MKAPRLFVFALFLALLSAVPVFSQNNLTLGEALKETSSYMAGRIPAGSRIAVLNIASGSKAVSDYILDELETLLVNDT
ncbi:MAG: hypothetical protein LBT68_04435, partial [Spirochaetales bacterium]|nr:hypothetical protein [Spirochaetales bacterium]